MFTAPGHMNLLSRARIRNRYGAIMPLNQEIFFCLVQIFAQILMLTGMADV